MYQKSILRLKQYLALDTENRYVPTTEAQSGNDSQWFCPDCHCPVTLLNNINGEDAWFEHLPPTGTTRSELSKCGHIRAEIRRRAFLQRMKALVDGLDTFRPVTHWFCVWCSSHYQGSKHCEACNTGIYSISRADWTWNYNQEEKTSTTITIKTSA